MNFETEPYQPGPPPGAAGSGDQKQEEAPRCPGCGSPLPGGQETPVCPHCVVGSLLNMDPLTGEEASPPPVAGKEIFDDVVPGVDLLMIKGSGGMGTVLKGRQLSLDRDVAVKIIRRDKAALPAYEAALQQEAQSMARLDHPGIVRVLDFGRTLGGNLYLLLEWVEGTTLRRLLNRRGALPAEEACALVLPLCAALQHAHDCCVVHRDLKPENILLTSDGQPKLADFGLARLGGRAQALPPGIPVPSRSGSSSTRSGSTLGTPAYMAPEQAGSADMVDRRADLFALAQVLLEMLSGVVPAAPEAGRESAAEAARHLPESTPAALRELVERNLSGTVEERAVSAQAFAEDLRRIFGWTEAGPVGIPRTLLPGRFSRRRWALGLGSATAGAALGIMAWERWKVPPLPTVPPPLGATGIPDPLLHPAVTNGMPLFEKTVVSRLSPPVDPCPGLTLGPIQTLRPALSSATLEEQVLPLDPGLSEEALRLRIGRHVETFLRSLDSDSPLPPDLSGITHFDTEEYQSGFLTFGPGAFPDKWLKYAKNYPHRFTVLLGNPVITTLSPGRMEARAVLWHRCGTGYRYGKMEASLRLELLAAAPAPPVVTSVRKVETVLTPQNAPEVRLSLFMMARLILESLAPESSNLLPLFFAPHHYYCGKPRVRAELEALVTTKSPIQARNRIRLLNGPEVARHSDWIHTGVFLAEALLAIPEAGLKAGDPCLVLLTMDFERVWPNIHSLTFRPLTPSPAAGPAAAPSPPPAK